MSSSKRSVKVALNDKASDDLKKVSQELGISESEVLRKGLIFMGLVAKLKDKEKETGEASAILLKEGDKTRELIIV